MEEKTYTLNICRTGTYQYEVTKPEIGVTKTATILDNALNITLHDILKHFTARSLILVFANQHIDRDCRNVEPHEYPQTAYKVTQMSIVSQVERSERELFFELSCPLTREQATWLDELEVELDTLPEQVRDSRKAAYNE